MSKQFIGINNKSYKIQLYRNQFEIIVRLLDDRCRGDGSRRHDGHY